jgi:hypothetical protein
MMNFELTAFRIEFLFDGKKYKATVEQTALSEGNEIFTVTGGSKSIQIKSNRPLIRSKGLNKRKIKMQAINANVKYQSVVEKIIEAIEEHIYKMEHKPFNWKNHPKNSI